MLISNSDLGLEAEKDVDVMFLEVITWAGDLRVDVVEELYRSTQLVVGIVTGDDAV